MDRTDTDLDGLTARQEFVAGTDPTNAASVFCLTTADQTGFGAFVLRWPSVSNRFYALRRSTNLSLGANGFTFLPGASNLPATPVTEFMDRDFLYVEPHDADHEVARKMAEYNLLALPVLDPGGRILGLVTVADALDVLLRIYAERGHFKRTVSTALPAVK